MLGRSSTASASSKVALTTPQVAKVTHAPTSRRPERIDLIRPSQIRKASGRYHRPGANDHPYTACAIPISERVVAERQITWQRGVDPQNGPRLLELFRLGRTVTGHEFLNGRVAPIDPLLSRCEARFYSSIVSLERLRHSKAHEYVLRAFAIVNE